MMPGVLEMTVEEGVADGVDQVRRAVRYQVKHGAQLIKICASGGVMFRQAARVPACRRMTAPASDVASFRAELRSWLDSHDLTPDPAAEHSLDAQVAQLSRVRAALHEADWMRYGWPAEVGGLGGPAVLRAVLGEEVSARGLAEPGIYSVVEVLAPTMISYAPPPLAAQMVPLLLNGALPVAGDAAAAGLR